MYKFGGSWVALHGKGEARITHGSDELYLNHCDINMADTRAPGHATALHLVKIQKAALSACTVWNRDGSSRSSPVMSLYTYVINSLFETTLSVTSKHQTSDWDKIYLKQEVITSRHPRLPCQ